MNQAMEHPILDIGRTGQLAEAGSVPPLLDVRDLRVEVRSRQGSVIPLVHGVDLSVGKGQSLAIVGESGSGKSVSMRALLGLLPKNLAVSGSVDFDGQDLLKLSPRSLRQVRGRRISMVFQNAMQALNPTVPLGRQLSEPLLWHDICGRKEALQRAARALDDVGIPDPEGALRRYPFQLSGGMQQRAMIAMAMITEPDLLIADEPTTAVDVTLQRQILDLINRVRRDDMSLVMITHDLGVARYVCNEVVVMYAGRVMERSPMADFVADPLHPYSRGLLDSALDVGHTEELRPIPGNPPEPGHLPTGCVFRPRCPVQDGPECEREQDLLQLTDLRSARCWKAGNGG